MTKPLGSGARPVRTLFLGLLAALAVVSGCVRDPGAAGGPFPRYAEYEGYQVSRVSFAGDLQLPADSLHAVTVTERSRCRLLFLPVCIPFTGIGRERHYLDLQELSRDVVRLQLYYRDHGYYGSRVIPTVEEVEPERVEVRFAIAPGDQVILRELTVEGVEEILDTEAVTEALPLTVGDPFRRTGFLQSADTIRTELLRRGHAYAEVLRNYALDTIADVAEVNFVALPGPLVVVDTIVFDGNERLTERTLRRQMTVLDGDILRGADLARSQRNLYSLEMVSFASVELGGDTVMVGPDTAQARVIVRVVEAPQYLVDASAGFGTVDCLRTGARWINRNFIGGGRRLEISGSLAKIGVAAPLAAGLENNVCGALRNDTLGQRLNYRINANIQQPRIFATQNQLGINLHSERVSELEVYMRESTGAQVSVTRQLGSRTLLTTTADVESGRTVASPIVLCIGFDTCATEDLERLQQRRWSNSISLLGVHDRTQVEALATRGYSLRGGVDWASPVLYSDNRYLRTFGEGSAYRSAGTGWVLAGNVRAGRFLAGTLGGEEGYIPPERRFYAGGPSSVRGYARNALGPTAYVSHARADDVAREDTVASPTGGTELLVSSIEIRGPSPWGGELIRVAGFVDMGHLRDPGTGLGTRGFRVTPGVGVRFTTPVGPIRLDLAYNPHAAEAGPLYRLDEARGLLLIQDLYQPPSPPAWSLRRVRLHFAVGQAF